MTNDEVRAALEREFDPAVVSIKAQTTNKDKSKCLAVPYLDARDVAERLTDVFGIGGWGFTWEPQFGDGNLIAAHGKLTLRTGVAETEVEEVGYSDDATAMQLDRAGNETRTPNQRLKGAVSDSLKRCAVLLGVGRYIYRLPKMWCDYDDEHRRPVPSNLAELLAAKGGNGSHAPSQPTGRSDGAAAPTQAVPCPDCLAAGRGGMRKFVKEGVNDNGPWKLFVCSLRKQKKNPATGKYETTADSPCDWSGFTTPEDEPDPNQQALAEEGADPEPKPFDNPAAADRTALIVRIKRAAEESLVSADGTLMDKPDLLTKKMNVMVGEAVRKLTGAVQKLTELTNAQMVEVLVALGGDP